MMPMEEAVQSLPPGLLTGRTAEFRGIIIMKLRLIQAFGIIQMTILLLQLTPWTITIA